MAIKEPKDLAEALAMIAALRADLATATTDLETATAGLEAAKGEHEVALALIAKGITDPDDRETILGRYARIPEADRPQFGKWFEKAAKADRIVSRILATPAEGKDDPAKGKDDPAKGKDDPAPKAEPAAAKAAPPDPGVGAGNTAPAATPKGWTPERLAKAPIADIRKGIADIRAEYGYDKI